jgi:hypothetical protein
MPRRKTRLPFAALALLVLPGLAVAQSMTPRPAAAPVALGPTVMAAIGQHTSDAVRQGAELAIAARKTGAPMRLPAVPVDTR